VRTTEALEDSLMIISINDTHNSAAQSGISQRVVAGKVALLAVLKRGKAATGKITSTSPELDEREGFKMSNAFSSNSSPTWRARVVVVI
jgi:hypothetical protein